MIDPEQAPMGGSWIHRAGRGFIFGVILAVLLGWTATNQGLGCVLLGALFSGLGLPRSELRRQID